MVAFHGCHTHFHTPSLSHTPPSFVHLAQSLGIDFESTRQRLLSLFDPEKTLPSFQQPPNRASMAATRRTELPPSTTTTHTTRRQTKLQWLPRTALRSSWPNLMPLHAASTPNWTPFSSDCLDDPATTTLRSLHAPHPYQFRNPTTLLLQTITRLN